METGIKYHVEWNGNEYVLTLRKTFTDDQKAGLNVSPGSLAFAVLNAATNEVVTDLRRNDLREATKES